MSVFRELLKSALTLCRHSKPTWTRFCVGCSRCLSRGWTEGSPEGASNPKVILPQPRRSTSASVAVVLQVLPSRTQMFPGFHRSCPSLGTAPRGALFQRGAPLPSPTPSCKGPRPPHPSRVSPTGSTKALPTPLQKFTPLTTRSFCSFKALLK